MKCRNLASRAAALVAALGLVAAAGAAPSTNVFIGAPNSSPDWDNIADALADTDSGGTVNVAAGVYNITSAIVISQPVTILGPQADVDPRSYRGLRTAGISEAVVMGDSLLGTLVSIQSSDVTINGLEFTGGQNSTATDYIETPAAGNHTGVVLSHNILHATNFGQGMELVDLSAPVIEYNYFFSITDGGATVQSALYLVNCDDAVIRRNEFSDILTDNDGAISVKTGSTNVLVEENWIHDGVGSVKKAGIEFGDPADGCTGTIRYNVIDTPNQSGIRLRVADVSVIGNEVTGNDTTWSERAGIYMTEGSNFTITGNRVHNNLMAGSVGGVRFLNTITGFGTTVVQGNELFGNTPAELRNEEPALVDATNNWWGQASGPGVGDIALANGGTVDSSSFLTTTDAGLPTFSTGNTYDFGIVDKTMTHEVTVSITNTSTHNLVILDSPGFNITGTDAARFSVAPGNLFPFIIPGGASRDLVIIYDPNNEDTLGHTATATLAATDAGEVDAIALMGATLAPPPPAELDSITVSDADGANGAQAGFTNDATVTVTFGTFGGDVSDIEVAEDEAFSANLASFTYSMQASEPYTLSGADGGYEVWARALGPGGNSAPTSTTITLDTGLPGQLGGGELTLQGGAQTDITSISADFTVTFDEPINTLAGMATTSGLTEDAISLASSTADTTNISIGISTTRAEDGPFTITLSGTAPATGDIIVEFVPGSVVDPSGNPLDVTGISSTLTLTTDVNDWLLLD